MGIAVASNPEVWEDSWGYRNAFYRLLLERIVTVVERSAIFTKQVIANQQVYFQESILYWGI